MVVLQLCEHYIKRIDFLLIGKYDMMDMPEKFFEKKEKLWKLK